MPPSDSEPSEPVIGSPPNDDAPTEVEVSHELPEARRRRRPRKNLVTIVLLGVALVGSLAALTFIVIQLNIANSTIERQQQQLDDQKNLIDKKETFGLTMNHLLGTAAKFDGTLMADIVPQDDYAALARLGWGHRWSEVALERDIAAALADEDSLNKLLASSESQAATNDSGSTYEAVSDRLGGGFVKVVIDNADALCAGYVLACVVSDDPYTIHIDAADSTLPYMTDWLQTGITYHEFAHVLQMTNPAPTETALLSFGGDPEVMADCFALTFLDGWTLDHRIWTSGSEYWDVSIGYGVTCDAGQAQAVRDWYSSLGFQSHSISQ